MLTVHLRQVSGMQQPLYDKNYMLVGEYSIFIVSSEVLMERHKRYV